MKSLLKRIILMVGVCGVMLSSLLILLTPVVVHAYEPINADGSGYGGGGSSAAGISGGSGGGNTSGGGGGNTSGSGGDDNCVSTSIIGGGEYCDSGDGQGIKDILGIAIDVLTFGVGTAAVLGVVISGIQYLTAGDNAGQMQKAKARILHIVIGLAVYAIFWGVLKFLLPGGLSGDGS